MRLFQQLATKEIQPYTTHAVKRMEHFSQTGILKGFARKQIKTHIMPVQSISENNLNSALTLESMHRLTRDFLNGDAISKLGSFNKFVSHLDGHLELLEDLNLQKIFGYIIHRYTLLEPAPSFLNTTEIQPTLLYHPHLWALDKDEVGTGLLPYLFMRFSYKLQLEHPTTPCYGLLPTSTPWVAMMLNNRFPEHFPSLNYSEEALKETDNRPQLKPHGIKIMQAALKRFYAISEQGPEPMKDCDLFHPRYSVKDSWFTGGFSDKARVIGNIGPAINIHTNFKKKIEENSSREEEEKEKPKDKESDKKNIFLTILPCNQTNLIHFVETINMLRQFGMQSLLSNTRATEQKESSFITDLFAILRLSEEQQARVGNPSKLCDLYSRFYNTQERPLHNAIIVNEQKDKRSHEEPEITTTEDFIIDSQTRVTKNKIPLKNTNKTIEFHTKIWNVNEIPSPYKSMIITRTHEITCEMFTGDATKINNFSLRFKRKNAHIELIFDPLKNNKLIGYVFHEPFIITQTKEGRKIKLLVYKSGLGCLQRKYIDTGIVPFLVRRYLIKIQLENPTLPCYALFRASYAQAYVAFAQDNEDFFPNVDPEKEISAKGQELLRLIIDADSKLRLYDTKPEARPKALAALKLQSSIADPKFGEKPPLVAAGLIIKEEKVPNSMDFLSRMAKSDAKKTFQRAIDLFTIIIYDQHGARVEFAYKNGQAISCIYPLSEATLSSMRTRKEINNATQTNQTQPKKKDRLEIILEHTMQIINFNEIKSMQDNAALKVTAEDSTSGIYEKLYIIVKDKKEFQEKVFPLFKKQAKPSENDNEASACPGPRPRPN